MFILVQFQCGTCQVTTSSAFQTPNLTNFKAINTNNLPQFVQWLISQRLQCDILWKNDLDTYFTNWDTTDYSVSGCDQYSSSKSCYPVYYSTTQEEMQYYLEHTFNMNYIESGPVNQPARNCEALEAEVIKLRHERDQEIKKSRLKDQEIKMLNAELLSKNFEIKNLQDRLVVAMKIPAQGNIQFPTPSPSPGVLNSSITPVHVNATVYHPPYPSPASVGYPCTPSPSLNPLTQSGWPVAPQQSTSDDAIPSAVIARAIKEIKNGAIFKKVVGIILEEMYGRNDLANYSLSGNKSPSMKDSTAKPALPEEVVTAIETFIRQQYRIASNQSSPSRQDIRDAISKKLLSCHTSIKRKNKKTLNAATASASSASEAIASSPANEEGRSQENLPHN